MPHWLAMVQSTQAPEPLQKSPEPQAVLAAVGGLLGVPAVHTSLVHALPSTGRSVLNAVLTVLPAPLHSSTWQLPAV